MDRTEPSKQVKSQKKLRSGKILGCACAQFQRYMTNEMSISGHVKLTKLNTNPVLILGFHGNNLGVMTMAGSVNKVIIIGNLGQDPEVRNFPNGGKVCNFSVATSENWKDKNTGERRERTEWHRVSITSEQLVRVAEQYLRKGSKVYLEGQLETRKWQDQSGQDKYTTEVVLRPYRSELTMLDGRSDSAQGGGTQGGSIADQSGGGYMADQSGGQGSGNITNNSI